MPVKAEGDLFWSAVAGPDCHFGVRSGVVQSALHYTQLDAFFRTFPKCVLHRTVHKVKDAIYCSGAETAILPRCVVGHVEEMQTSVDAFAQAGLRTLVMAERRLSNEEWIAFLEELNEASNLLVDREKRLQEVYDYLESNLVLLGATGVEDRLQDGVAETLESLRVAGVRTWILTGDKQETAVNVSYSCGHFKKSMQVCTALACFLSPWLCC